MKIDILEVTKNSDNVGKTFWVCDYRKPDINKKAIRHVKPTCVMVLNEKHFEDLGKKFPRVYYSAFVLVPIDRKGKLKYSQYIVPYDNTGYRSYTGIPLNVFDNEQECIDFYNKQIDIVLKMYQDYMSTIIQSLSKEHNEIENLKLI